MEEKYSKLDIFTRKSKKFKEISKERSKKRFNYFIDYWEKGRENNKCPTHICEVSDFKGLIYHLLDNCFSGLIYYDAQINIDGFNLVKEEDIVKGLVRLTKEREQTKKMFGEFSEQLKDWNQIKGISYLD